MKVLFIIIFILILFIILLSIPVYVSIGFSNGSETDKMKIQIRYLFFKINPLKDKKKEDVKEKSKDKQLKKDKKNKTAKKESFSFNNLKQLYNIYKKTEDDIADILWYFSKKAVAVRLFSLKLRFGTADAMQTGLATGAAYAAVYNLISLLNNLFAVEKCDVSITPVFEKPMFEIDTKCIIKVKNVHITVIAFKVLKMYLKILKLKKRKER